MFKFSYFFKIILVFICICSFFSFSYADDIMPEEDDFDISSYLNSDIEASSNSSEFPTINSRAYVVIDRKSSTVLVGKNEYAKKKMASTTKIMTSLIIIENCNLSDTVTISKKAANTGGSRLGLKTGDKITVHDLLYGLMLRSGNDAAVALAEYTSGSIPEFANLMNKKAEELGLTNTHFVTPHGLDQDEHYTTAYELALLTNYALNNSKFCQIVGSKTYTITINGYTRTLTNTNELLGVLDGVYGVKTGFTNGANRCLVTSCKRGDMDIICVVLGADTKKFRTQDSIKLINYSFSNFSYINISEIINDEFNKWKDNNCQKFNVYKGISNNVELYYTKPFSDFIPVKKDLQNKIHVYISCNFEQNAPLLKDNKIGNISIYVDTQLQYTLDILVKNTVEKKNIFDYLYDFCFNFKYCFNGLFK